MKLTPPGYELEDGALGVGGLAVDVYDLGAGGSLSRGGACARR